jgi:CheY-like chemotaxis protein
MRILLVDDEPDFVAVIKLTLEMKGYQVLAAYDGEEALAMITKEMPDLIILDVLMPKISGDDVAAALKNSPATYSIPIIFLTNVPLEFLTTVNIKNRFFQRDSHGSIYLRKSCSEDELLAAIGQALNL